MNKNEYVYGMRSVMESIQSGKEINKILLKQRLNGELFQQVFQTIRKAGIPFQYVPEAKLNQITRQNHQGIIALLSSIEYQPIENIVPTLYEQGKQPFILVLDRVSDVRNFGAIARSAECAGVDAIVVPEKGGALINSDAMKTSSGALQHINICRSINIEESVKFLKNSGLTVFAVTEKATEPYFNHSFTEPVAFILGNEETGISEELMKLADRLIKIPMAGQIQSLNVSAATSIVLFECAKQRYSTGS